MNPLFNAGKSLKGIRDMARAMSTVGQIRKLISGKDPAQVAQVLAKTNPQFAAFWDKNASRPLNDFSRTWWPLLEVREATIVKTVSASGMPHARRRVKETDSSGRPSGSKPGPL